MERIVKNPAVALLVATVFSLAVSRGQGGLSPLVPPQSHAFGKSFDEWNVLQTQFALATGLGGQTNVSNTVDGVRLLPGSFTDPEPVFHISLRPGTPFVASPFFLFGERYDDGSADDPDELAPVLDEIFANAKIQIMLDGRVLLEGSGSELQNYLFGPTFLDQPVTYAEPQPRGNVNAVQALWVTGIGAVFHPLPVGGHVLEYVVQSDFVGNLDFTYFITVSPH